LYKVIRGYSYEEIPGGNLPGAIAHEVEICG
jgi:hypothetical protein